MNIMINNKHINLKRQSGMSLVELMVAITISLVLIAGISQILLGSKSSYNMQNGLGRLQENARYAMDILSNNIRMAGYTTGVVTLTPINSANTLENATANADLGFAIASGTASDIIEINYDSATDCLGNATPAGTATDRYYINGTDLMCLGNGDLDNPGILAEGIENMQIMYGVDSDDDDIPNSYVNADNVSDWADVKAAQIALLVNTVDNAAPAASDNTYVLLNTAAVGPMADRLMRRVFSQTVMIRN